MKIDFKSRVKYFYKGKYEVQWTNEQTWYGRTKWRTICFWYGSIHPDSSGFMKLSGWHADHWYYEEAENIAKSLKSVKDVNEHYEEDNEKKRLWDLEEAKFWKDIVKCESKEFT